jgi:hypothetical protein
MDYSNPSDMDVSTGLRPELTSFSDRTRNRRLLTKVVSKNSTRVVFRRQIESASRRTLLKFLEHLLEERTISQTHEIVLEPDGLDIGLSLFVSA